MSQPFLAEISMFAGNFAPRGWSFCDGQLLPISQNTALFSLLGTNYGGDGRTTFGIPDLRGRTPIGTGTGPGLSHIRLAQKLGNRQYVINSQNMPAHSHVIGPISLPVSTNAADGQDVEDNYLAATAHNHYHNATDSSISINAPATTGSTGSNTALSTYQPSLAVNHIIAIQGTFPSRS